LLDGDKLEPIHRFPSRYACMAGRSFTPGRYVFFASRDGWGQQVRPVEPQVVAEIRAGINTRNVAVSGDGKYLAVANYLPHTLVLLDADLNLLKVLPVRDKDGKESSARLGVYDAAPRQSFVAALKDVPEVWEISYGPQGRGHPVGMITTSSTRKRLHPRLPQSPSQLPVDALDDFFFTRIIPS